MLCRISPFILWLNWIYLYSVTRLWCNVVICRETLQWYRAIVFWKRVIGRSKCWIQNLSSFAFEKRLSEAEHTFCRFSSHPLWLVFLCSENTNHLLYLSQLQHPTGLCCRILSVLNAVKVPHRHFISSMKRQDVHSRPCVLKFWSADALPVGAGIIAFSWQWTVWEYPKAYPFRRGILKMMEIFLIWSASDC